jgi:murein DD-endopeptidase MepM/ murein hydrolase activator NlpD
VKFLLPILAAYFLMRKKTTKGTLVVPLEIRNDSQGSGVFNASRGARAHKGVDYLVEKGQNVFSPVDGKVTRIAYPYASDLKWKGLVIVSGSTEIRIFYITPLDGIIGEQVKKGDRIATAQAINEKYTPSMKNHIHVEWIINGTHKDPSKYLNA